MKLIDFILGRKPREVEEVVEEERELDVVEEQFLETMSLEPDYDFRMECSFLGGPLQGKKRYLSGGQQIVFIPFSPTGDDYANLGLRILENGQAIAVYTKRLVGVYMWDGNITIETLDTIKDALVTSAKVRQSKYLAKQAQKRMEEANVG